MLVRLADGRTTFIDFRERAPASGLAQHVSGRGRQAHRGQHHRLSRVGRAGHGARLRIRFAESTAQSRGPDCWRPAVELAAKGFPLSYGTAQSLRASARDLSRFPESKRIFLRDGKYYEPGETFVQPELARTLERIARLGARDFYEGETAHLLAEDMAGARRPDHAGRSEELPRSRAPAAHRQLPRLLNRDAPPPSSGGVGILQMLGVLEGTGYEKAGAGSAIAVHYMAEAMRRYFADRARVPGRSGFREGAARRAAGSGLHSRSCGAPSTRNAPRPAARSMRAVIHRARSGRDHALYHCRCGGQYRGGDLYAEWRLRQQGDARRAWDSCSTTRWTISPPSRRAPTCSGWCRAKPTRSQPRKTPLSSMTPTIVLKDGKPFLALGSPGGPTIINTVLEVIVNVVDFGMNVQDAVNWPRFHHQWLPDELRMEPGYSPDTIALLEKRGYTVKPGVRRAKCAAILFDDGWLEGARRSAHRGARRKDTERRNEPRTFDAPVRQSPADRRAAGPDRAGRDPGRGDLLRAAAPGLSRQGADRRAGPLVSRFRI